MAGRQAGGGGAVGIAEVARLAGVSTATVSRTLANPEVVSLAMRERVMAAVRGTGYTPNVAGRNLRARRSMMVLVVMPTMENLVFADVLRGVDAELAAAGYGLIIGNLDDAHNNEGRFVDLAFSGQVDGVLLVNGYVPASEGRTVTDAGRPVAGVSVPIAGAALAQVVAQDREGSAAIARHLTGLGHRRLAYVAGHGPIDDERRLGFFEAAAEAGIAPSAIAVLEGDFSFAAGARAAARFLAFGDRPTGVFATSDAMAVSFINTVRRAGLRVPEDVSVAGFDGVGYGDFCDPPLTTAVQPRREMGRLAARCLVEQMRGNAPAPPRQIRLEAPLLVRESTGIVPTLPSGVPA